MNNSLIPFYAHWLARGGVMQTILGSQFPGEALLPERKTHKIPIEAQSSIIAYELESNNDSKPIVLLGHGMGGCSESGYIRRIAAKLWNGGHRVFMMNQLGSGPGMGLSDNLWNGGSSEVLDHMVKTIVRLYPKQPLLLIGFSLSGNVLLKYLGEGRKIPGNVQAGFAVNPPIDLKIASQLLSNGYGSGIFNAYFIKMIRRQCKALAEGFPDAVQPQGQFKTIWDFDVVYTAPASGYRDVDEYYRKCSARQFLNSIQTPTRILCAQDDPFIPLTVFDGIDENGSLTTLFPDRGGHMGYLSAKPTPLGDSRWMDYVILDWVEKSD